MAADWDTSGFREDGAFDEREARPTRRRRSGWLSSRRRRYGLITGLVSLAIIGAFIWSGHDRGEAEFAEAPPTIHADDAPIRVPPENPGGMEIPHQDKLVYQRRPGEGEDLTMERLLPPPEQPMAPPIREPAAAAEPEPEPALPLARETLAEEESNGEEAVTPLVDPVTGAPSASPTPLSFAAAAPRPAGGPPTRPTRALPSESETVARTQSPPTTATATEAPQRLFPSPMSASPSSPPPAAGRSGSGAPTATANAAPTATALASPPPAAAGGYMIQLLAVSSVDQAQAAWARLKDSNTDLLGRLSPSYARADLGGGRGVIYRLRAGPLDGETRARSLCAQLAGRNVDCMIVSPSG